MRHGRPCGVGTVGARCPGQTLTVECRAGPLVWDWRSRVGPGVLGYPSSRGLQGLSLGAMELCAAVHRCFREGLLLPGVGL